MFLAGIQSYFDNMAFPDNEFIKFKPPTMNSLQPKVPSDEAAF
jgi:hypothetical protein